MNDIGHPHDVNDCVEGQRLPLIDAAEDRCLSGLKQAATICGVSERTIRRKRQAGAFPNAVQDARGRWRIPVDDLYDAGLRPHLVAPLDNPLYDTGPHRADVAVHARQLEMLRVEVAELQRERDIAQTAIRYLEDLIARQDATIEDLRGTIAFQCRQLEPAPEPKPNGARPGAGPL